MRNDPRDTLVLPFIDREMGDAPFEEKLRLTQEFWEFFDAVNAAAERITSERSTESVTNPEDLLVLTDKEV